MIATPSGLIAAGLALWIGSVAIAAAAPSGQRCGGYVGLKCGAGTWCERPAGMCHGSDIMGTCVRAAEFCSRIYLPVCGCDGRTYGNDCERRSRQVGLSHVGHC